jgi:hypothetical protein
MNPNVMPSSQGSGGHGATVGGGPQEPAADAAHGSGDPAPEPDSVAGVTAVGDAPSRAEPTTGASSLEAQMGAMTPPSHDDDEFVVVMGRPNLQAPRRVSLPKAAGIAQSMLNLVQ